MSRYDLSREALRDLLADAPRYRSDQIWDGLYRRYEDPAEMTVLPRELRERLALEPALSSALVQERSVAADRGDTLKWLLALGDGARIETVLMHHPRHSTVCVSSQAGCVMGCSFCATGQGGYTRHLTVGEIVEQVVLAARAASESGRRLDNVVMMGMGEPMANYANVLEAVRRMIQEIGIGARHVTISTVGIIPGIRRLAAEPLQVNLAVSLHAANDELRNGLVPMNKRYPIARLMEECAEYCEATHRRISFEWALIDQVNDRASDAAELAQLARPLRAHVNLIPLNPTPGYPAVGTPPGAVRAFRDRLASYGVNVTVRKTRGQEIAAACGQLVVETPVGLTPRRGVRTPTA